MDVDLETISGTARSLNNISGPFDQFEVVLHSSQNTTRETLNRADLPRVFLNLTSGTAYNLTITVSRPPTSNCGSGSQNSFSVSHIFCTGQYYWKSHPVSSWISHLFFGRPTILFFLCTFVAPIKIILTHYTCTMKGRI